MKSVNLESLYATTNEKTHAIWLENSGSGKQREEDYYDPQKLALAAGIRPLMPHPVNHLLDELNELARHDPLADVLPKAGFHFTFLPLTLPLYQQRGRLPEKSRQLANIWADYEGKTLSIHHLRLVALPSQLLLAGIPDEPAVAMRHAFCEQILNSPWKEELLARHAQTPLPAPFWHSTLLRYRAAFLPEVLREFFRDRQSLFFGDVSGQLTLARINYNWTKCYPLSMQHLDASVAPRRDT
ncbi:hypothetical protein AAEY27_13070 [Kosakonia sp. BYX6]|uniref:Relaxase n=1 Tax=Kosakonia calanthes TaxID=3139408 RepID=A0ABZ3B1F2_9ENTR